MPSLARKREKRPPPAWKQSKHHTKSRQIKLPWRDTLKSITDERIEILRINLRRTDIGRLHGLRYHRRKNSQGNKLSWRREASTRQLLAPGQNPPRIKLRILDHRISVKSIRTLNDRRVFCTASRTCGYSSSERNQKNTIQAAGVLCDGLHPQ